jgi:hypothetical protein
MPSDELFAGAFAPELVTLLAGAFDLAWETVEKSGSPLAAPEQAATTRDLLARYILDLGRDGERNKQRLVDGAIERLLRDIGRRHPPV